MDETEFKSYQDEILLRQANVRLSAFFHEKDFCYRRRVQQMHSQLVSIIRENDGAAGNLSQSMINSTRQWEERFEQLSVSFVYLYDMKGTITVSTGRWKSQTISVWFKGKIPWHGAEYRMGSMAWVSASSFCTLCHSYRELEH